jgi:hypothetical protein
MRSGELSIDYNGLPLLNMRISLGEDLLEGIEASPHCLSSERSHLRAAECAEYEWRGHSSRNLRDLP